MTPEEQDQGQAASGAAADWMAQAQALTNAWAAAQSKLWGDWAAATTRPTATAEGLLGGWLSQWQALVRGSLRDWTAVTDETTRAAAARLLTGEQAFLSFVEMAFGMMKAVAPKIDVGDEWVELLRRFLAQTRDDMARGRSAWLSPEGGASAMGDMTELWRLYSAELQRLMGPWAAAYRDAALDFGQAGAGDPKAMYRMFAGFVDAYEVTFGHFLSAPSVGYTRESSERFLKGFDAWLEMNRAGADFQTELANTGMHAVESLVRRLVDMGEKGERITSLHAFFDLWMDTVEKAYYELFGSEPFATLQGRFVNASLLYRKRQGELLDEAMAVVGLPGRKEVDQIHRHVHDLRIELRWLRREVRALRRELEDAPAPARRRRRPPAPESEAPKP
jgi:class III poly(R)-hydroxyalkanoic acid synthase PhaE subunit